jgi:hypothetical protein
MQQAEGKGLRETTLTTLDAYNGMKAHVLEKLNGVQLVCTCD